jgi:hypothetical protein
LQRSNIEIVGAMNHNIDDNANGRLRAGTHSAANSRGGAPRYFAAAGTPLAQSAGQVTDERRDSRNGRLTATPEL